MARIKQGVFSWEDVLVQRYQSNKPPALPRRRRTLSGWQPQPQCYLLSRLSPELRLMIWEYVLGSHRLHIIQRSGQKLGHMVCPLSENRTIDKTRRRVYGNFCEICTGAGIAQPVKEGDLHRRDFLLGLALTSRQIYDESIHLLYTLNTFEFSNPWTLPYLRPTLPSNTWEWIRNVELRWSFPGHWLPSKDPVRAVYVSAGRVQWLETCRMLKKLPALQSFVLVLGSSWFCEPVEKLPVFLEPLIGLRVNCPRGLVRRPVGLDPELWEISSDEESASSLESGSGSGPESGFNSSPSSFSLTSRVGVNPISGPRPVLSSRSYSCPQLARGKLQEKQNLPVKEDLALASWELRLQGQSYYANELGKIGEDFQRRGIDCCITTA
ncbi:hypothetical protein N7523_001875 [Penicillium sp. IBT 18751x]|nr:hypothetical protein N7523_001875 [Penicillium sp. IBT 18751x]